MRCDLDGTDVEVVFATATGIDGIATDPATARDSLYSALAAGEIRAVGDDGTGDTAIVATGADPRELSFDRLSQHLYWAERAGRPFGEPGGRHRRHDARRRDCPASRS